MICPVGREERWFFVLNQVPFLLLSFFGMGMVGLATGIWWPILAYSLAGVAFLGPVEMAALCRHCPHYAREGSRLRCIGPNPFPKLVAYDPRPLNTFEKVIVILFSIFMLSFPSLIQAYGTWLFFAWGGGFALLGMVGVNLATAMAALQFAYILTHHFCPRCINFSCPLNRAPEEVKRLLERDPAILDEAEKSGRRPVRRGP
ncbi:hypothetical protein [Methanocrinis sp.]|uniref:hypothetical protein n=1 Tax=Methanocrinis sp. TaxID=3101522 RepID=UPI003D10DF24